MLDYNMSVRNTDEGKNRGGVFCRVEFWCPIMRLIRADSLEPMYANETPYKLLALHSFTDSGLLDHLDEHAPSLLWGDYLAGKVDASTFHPFIGLQSK